MEAEGCPHSPLRAICVQSAGRDASQPLLVRDTRGRSSLRDFDEWCVDTLAAESARLLGSTLSVEEVRNRFQPTLRTHECSGSQSLRLKMNTAGRAAVRVWSPVGT